MSRPAAAEITEEYLLSWGFKEPVKGIFERQFLGVYYHVELQGWYARAGSVHRSSGLIRLDSRKQLCALLFGLGIEKELRDE